MAKKSEFFGTCQVCGREQKLPNGILSTHGYTVEWNMFTGECFGSKELPFEQSTDLIQRAVLTASVKRGSLAKHQDCLALPPKEPYGTVKSYLTREEVRKKDGHFINGRAGYRWITGRIERREPHKMGMYFVVIDEKDGMEHRIHGGFMETPLSVVEYFNKEYSRVLQNRIDQLDKYVLWQTERIKNWHPKELKSVKNQKLTAP